MIKDFASKGDVIGVIAVEAEELGVGFQNSTDTHRCGRPVTILLIQERTQHLVELIYGLNITE